VTFSHSLSRAALLETFGQKSNWASGLRAVRERQRYCVGKKKYDPAWRAVRSSECVVKPNHQLAAMISCDMKP
jgi:hypothetical protein